MPVDEGCIHQQRIIISKSQCLKTTWKYGFFNFNIHISSRVIFKGLTYAADWGHYLRSSASRNWLGKDLWPH